MWASATDVKKAGNEFAHASLVGETEAGPAYMIMLVDVEKGGRFPVHGLEHFAKGVPTDAGADSRIVDVALVSDRMPDLAQYKQTSIAQRGDSASKEADSLGRKRVSSRKIIPHLC